MLPGGARQLLLKQGAKGRTLPPARNKHALSAHFVSEDTPPDGIEGQHRASQ